MKATWLIIMWVSVFLVISSFADSVSASEKEFEIGVTKGAYAIENGSYAEAQTYLKKALEINQSDPQALLLMGIALSRVENYSEAREYLTEALQQEPGSWRAKFELGVVQYHLGSWDMATKLFEDVRASDADKHAKSVARKYIARMTTPDDKPYSLKLYAGWQYDDNVILEPENPGLFDGEDETDWRWLAVVDGKLAFLQTERFRVEAGYMFFHSFHQDLDQFDVEQHNASLGATYDPAGPIEAELRYQFSYSKVDDYEYSKIHTIGTIVSYTHTPQYQDEKFRTEVHYAHEFQDYEYNEFDSWFETINSYFNSLRTGDNDVIGITQKILFNKHHLLSLDYTFNRKRADEGEFPEEDFWGYNGHKGTVTFTSNIKKWQLHFSGSYQEKAFDEEYWPSWWGDIYRRDKVQEYSAAITWNPFNWLSISLTENYVINESNLQEADYKRNIIGVVVGVGI